MGMFDWVKYEYNCPHCGATQRSFQSKDGECLLEFLNPDDVARFYSHCEICNYWLEFNLDMTSDHRQFILNENHPWNKGLK